MGVKKESKQKTDSYAKLALKKTGETAAAAKRMGHARALRKTVHEQKTNLAMFTAACGEGISWRPPPNVQGLTK